MSIDHMQRLLLDSKHGKPWPTIRNWFGDTVLMYGGREAVEKYFHEREAPMKANICDLCKSRQADHGFAIDTLRDGGGKRIRFVPPNASNAKSHACSRCIAIIQDLGHRPDILTFPGKPTLQATPGA